MAEIYFRFSAESFVIRRPHTQYMTPGLPARRVPLIAQNLNVERLPATSARRVHAETVASTRRQTPR